ncbi:hypothetical protein LDL59_02320 [Kaistella anthropi]|nr:hypothetical protein [Kaistella anthropi]
MDAGNAQFSANYVTGSSFLYPYGVVRHLPNKLLVAQLRQGERKQDFKYKDLLYHLQSRGMIGFRQTARSSHRHRPAGRYQNMERR